ncbi:hypothetical protein [Methylocella sp.]|uniref:hypothetical protein n=1 Tax=Methylocella sp. TaxID=1978226 RepID=UPI0035B2E7B2
MKMVIVRPAWGTPKAMVAVGASKTTVYVVSPDSTGRLSQGLTQPVGVPREDVLEFNAKELDDMQAGRKKWPGGPVA